MGAVIQTPCGQIRGVSLGSSITAYKGVRYATAGRWEYPKLVTHWDGVYEAVEYGPCAYQNRAFAGEARSLNPSFAYREFRKGQSFQYSEDCLFLNLFVPARAKPGDRLPVVIFIHGGGFLEGCGHEKPFDGPRWAEHGVIGVTFNYRLGPLGFACLPQLHEEAGHSGNYGLYDQLAAMEWIRDNVSAFGGDPDNVTLMGQNSGSMSITLHCTNTLSAGLFHKAVMSSGGGVRHMHSIVSTEVDRYSFWQQVMEEAACQTLEEFRALPPARLYMVYNTLRKREAGLDMVAGVCLDGHIMPERPVMVAQEGRARNIPYLMGSNSRDQMPPVTHGMALDWCKNQSHYGMQPCYCWFFDRALPGDTHGAWHGADLWYWFGTLKNGWRPWRKKDYEISRQMVGYLTNFARNGDPNGPGLPQWKPVSGSHTRSMHLGDGHNRMDHPSVVKLWYTMLVKRSPIE